MNSAYLGTFEYTAAPMYNTDKTNNAMAMAKCYTGFVLPSAPRTRYQWRKHVSPYDLLPPDPVIYDIGS